MTSANHQSGSDRIAEAVKDIPADIIVNVQADEPETDPACIDKLVELLQNDKTAQMATLVTQSKNPTDIENPNIVKCVVSANNRALYFSRLPIPYNRDNAGLGQSRNYLQHLGLYAYRRDFLLEITQKPQTPLELSEKLEQLRALEYGYDIAVAKVSHRAQGIDTPEQYAEFVKRMKNTQETGK
jgi:3-deoxy-manno-octulosonate cytidylyltransferase (CMP-KDO synthetase)